MDHTSKIFDKRKEPKNFENQSNSTQLNVEPELGQEFAIWVVLHRICLGFIWVQFGFPHSIWAGLGRANFQLGPSQMQTYF